MAEHQLAYPFEDLAAVLQEAGKTVSENPTTDKHAEWLAIVETSANATDLTESIRWDGSLHDTVLEAVDNVLPLLLSEDPKDVEAWGAVASGLGDMLWAAAKL